MRILAIETSGQAGSVALLLGTSDTLQLVRDAAVSGGTRTAQALAPLTKDLLARAEWPADSIELVAVAVGPGSFTGLRIGVTMAKTFAYAVGAQIIGVNTLEIVAQQAQNVVGPLWAVMDAQRQELFAAKFAAGGEPSLTTMEVETRILSQTEWIAALELGDVVTGSGLRRLAAPLPAGIVMADEELWQPTAATVGRIAWQNFQAGRRDDLWKLVPKYYRPSAAEEKMTGSLGDKEKGR
jgi:tRNA threonylcarbamoyladenosine biosynthesis protein TsaB